MDRKQESASYAGLYNQCVADDRASLKILASGWDKMDVQELGMNRRNVTSRIIRPGQPIPLDDEWLACSVAERVLAVWTLTKQCYEWRRESVSEPRLHRDISKVQRSHR